MDKTRTLFGESRKNQIRLLSLNIIQSQNGLKAVGFLLLFVFSFRVPLSVYFQYTDKYADNPTTGIRVGCQKKPHLSEKNKGTHGSDFLPAKRFAMWTLLEGERQVQAYPIFWMLHKPQAQRRSQDPNEQKKTRRQKRPSSVGNWA